MQKAEKNYEAIIKIFFRPKKSKFYYKLTIKIVLSKTKAP